MPVLQHLKQVKDSSVIYSILIQTDKRTDMYTYIQQQRQTDIQSHVRQAGKEARKGTVSQSVS